MLLDNKTATLSPQESSVIQPSTINLLQSAPINEPAKKRRLLLIAAAVAGCVLVIFLVAVVTFLIVSQRQPPPAPPPPEPIVNPAPPKPSSKFATDAGVLQLQKDARNTLGEIDGADLSEPEIVPPVLDLRLNIPPQF